MTGSRVTLDVVDPLGSIATTLTLDGATRTVAGLGVYDEYGNAITSGPSTGALSYGWLGGKERATDGSGLVLMGVRLYNSVTGLFTSVDPVEGGNETVYGYPSDPVNKLDLDGRKGWWSRNWGKVVVAAVVIVAVACVAASGGGCIGAIATGVRTARALPGAVRLLRGVKAGKQGLSATARQSNLAGRIWTRGERTAHSGTTWGQPFTRYRSLRTGNQYRTPTMKNNPGYKGKYSNFESGKTNIHVRIR